MQSDLHELVRSAAAGPAGGLDLTAIYRRGRRRAAVRGTVSVAGVGLVVAAGVAAAGILPPVGGGSRPTDPAWPGQENSSPSPSSSAEACGGFDVCSRVGSPVEQILVGDEAVWAAGFGIVRIDPATNEVTAREDLGAWAVAVFRDDRYVWAVAESDGVDDPTVRVSAMHPATLAVAGRSEALPATNTGDIHAAIGQGAVWVTGPRGALHRVDTDTFEVESFSYEGVFDPDPQEGPPLVAVAGETVWLAQGDGTLVAVDPRDGRVTGGPIELGSNVRAMTAHGGDLLVVLYDGEGRLVRLSGGRETGSANLPEGGPLALAARDDDVFVLLEGPAGDTVVGLDATTLEILDPIDNLDTSGGMGAGPAGVWLSDFPSGTVFRERP